MSDALEQAVDTIENCIRLIWWCTCEDDIQEYNSDCTHEDVCQLPKIKAAIETLRDHVTNGSANKT
jgi:hypothetical protein